MLEALAITVLCTAQAPAVDFEREIAPIFAAKCLHCHGPEKQKSGYRLDVRTIALLGGDSSAPNVHPGDADASPMARYIAGLDKDMVMPPKGERMTDAEVALVRRWINEGAQWPETASVQTANPLDWWSLRALVKPQPPAQTSNPIDAFISARLAKDGLAMAKEADARTLCRRVYFDLIGLPPTPEEIDAYAADATTDKYERLVDRLLASPRYGERWARHWLDVVHYADTHGYDKDKPREHAWPYRDYVIRALNEDKPYSRFVEEQIAGDALFPGTRDGVEALGFIAAGPWDFIGHEEVSEAKIDGKFARHFDRDDMVGNAIGTFASVTVQCAQCHNHKFDPVSQEDYYALQAVFAAVDRADKRYDATPEIARKRDEFATQRTRLRDELKALDAAFANAAGDALVQLDREIAAATPKLASARPGATPGAATEQDAPDQNAPEYGYHSEISLDPHAEKWVQVDLGASRAFNQVVLAPCSDSFNGIGAGFGFPEEFRVEASDDPEFKSHVQLIATATRDPRGANSTALVPFDTQGVMTRYVRVRATTLAHRKGDFIFALGELQVIDAAGRNIAQGAAVTSFDSIELADRWRRVNLTDGIYPALVVSPERAAQLRTQRDELRRQLETNAVTARRAEIDTNTARADESLAALPAPMTVYAATIHTGTGSFAGTGAKGGKPREIRILSRGQVTQPGKVVEPAALSALNPLLPSRFGLTESSGEGERRAALAKWLVDSRNPLIWRTMANRVWHYHFGHGISDTPNDFGRMGATPTHPELLDWLAATFRDDMQGSLKSLHRLIVTSAAYRQRSDVGRDAPSAAASAAAESIDSANTLLWRANTRKLEAEAVRDAVLATTGSLDLAMGGPGFRDFVIEQPEHSPHYRYDLADPNDGATFRRSVYRFIVRSQMQPFMTTLDCADPSQRVDKRNQSVSPNQALAYLNNGFMLAQSQRFAQRVRRDAGESINAQINRAMRLALGRAPEPDEQARLVDFAGKHGLENACRVILNLNEFSFID